MRMPTAIESIGINLFLTACGAVVLGLACAVLGCGSEATTMVVTGAIGASLIVALGGTAEPMRARERP